MAFFSKLKRAVGLSIPKVRIPDVQPFPETEYARSLTEAQKYATGLADMLSSRRKQGLSAQGRTQSRELQRALARRGLSNSGSAVRGMREIQESQRMGERDIGEERGRMIQEAVARQAAQRAEASRWYSGLINERALQQAQAKAQRDQFQQGGRLGLLLAALKAGATVATMGAAGPALSAAQVARLAAMAGTDMATSGPSSGGYGYGLAGGGGPTSMRD